MDMSYMLWLDRHLDDLQYTAAVKFLQRREALRNGDIATARALEDDEARLKADTRRIRALRDLLEDAPQ